jgi:3-isopropylmalate dehydratase small subunit
VIAKSFARIFYRNAINIGFPILECEEAASGIDEGDQIQVDLASGRIINLTKNEAYEAQPFPEFMQQIIAAGGLINYVMARQRE